LGIHVAKAYPAKLLASISFEQLHFLDLNKLTNRYLQRIT